MGSHGLVAQTGMNLVSFSSVWKYNQSGADLGTAWRQPGYNDSGWNSGAGVLAYPNNENILGVAPIQTVLDLCINGGSVRPCTGGQVRTYYFRHTFNFAGSPGGVALTATNVFDDGAIVYLNGEEVARFGMATGPVNYQTGATRSDDVSQHGIETFAFPVGLLVHGENVLAVEIHQGGSASSDVVMGMDVWTGGPALLVPDDHVWKYDDSTTDLGTAWRDNNYNDASWASGPGTLGFENTVLNPPLRTTLTRTENNYTYYFRTTFEFGGEPLDVELEFRMQVDDGAVVYLNNVEAFRVGMDNGPVNHTTTANRTVGNASLEIFTVPATALVQGVNHLAVESHQVNGTSSDIVMGMTLYANSLPPTALSITNEPQDMVLEELKPATLSVGVSGQSPRFQW